MFDETMIYVRHVCCRCGFVRQLIVHTGWWSILVMTKMSAWVSSLGCCIKSCRTMCQYLEQDLCNEQFSSCYSLLEQETRCSRVSVRCNVYSNSSTSKSIVSLMCTLFYIGVHESKVDRTEHDEQYLIGQSIVTFNEWCISLGIIWLGVFHSNIFCIINSLYS
jgi:hypothetical protein